VTSFETKCLRTTYCVTIRKSCSQDGLIIWVS